MADSKKQTIGDPLAEAAQSGMLGARRPITSRQEPEAAPPSASLAVESETSMKQPEPGKMSQREKKTTARERKQRTILLEFSLSRWLDIQAASEQRELSDVVADALQIYKKLHPQEN